MLHHLPKLLAETVVFVSGSGLGCWLVVATVQARAESSDVGTSAAINLLTDASDFANTKHIEIQQLDSYHEINLVTH